MTKIFQKPKIVHHRRDGKIGFCDLNNPKLRLQIHEAIITNGLGYEPINHHVDSKEGLLRHFVEMELRETKTDKNVYRAIMDEMSANTFNLYEDRNFYHEITSRLLDSSNPIQEGILINRSAITNLLKDLGVNIKTKNFNSSNVD